MKNNFSGVTTALISPFKGGDLDLKSFKKMVHNQLEQKIDGLVINGTTGESPTLNVDEIKQLFELAKTECQGTGVKLIIGTGSNSTMATCELSKLASSWGPSALLVVVPYYNRPPQRGMIAHFTEVAKASSCPILLYNVPGRTVANLEPESVHTLSRVANIAGIKDATGDMNVLSSIRAGVGADFSLLSGDDASCVEFCERGGHGVISVSSHVIGAEMREAILKAKAGDAKANPAYRELYQELMRCLYIEANPIPIKMAVQKMGLIESAEMRLPLMALDEKYHGEMTACLKKLGKI